MKSLALSGVRYLVISLLGRWDYGSHRSSAGRSDTESDRDTKGKEKKKDEKKKKIVLLRYRMKDSYRTDQGRPFNSEEFPNLGSFSSTSCLFTPTLDSHKERTKVFVTVLKLLCLPTNLTDVATPIFRRTHRRCTLPSKYRPPDTQIHWDPHQEVVISTSSQFLHVQC